MIKKEKMEEHSNIKDENEKKENSNLIAVQLA